jgi:subfamily B ATP-binding cassette protein MsbA
MSTGRLFARLWREHVSHYKSEIALLVPVLAAVALAAVSYAGVLKFATDAINAGDLNGVYFWAMIAVVATAVRALAMWLQAVMSQGIALKVLRDLQGAMFAKLMRVDFARFGREAPGRLISRFTNDINVISEGLVRGGQTAIRDSLTLIGAVGSMLYFDWVLTLVVLGIFALAAWPMQRIAESARRRTRAAQLQVSTLTGLLAETFGAMRFVKTYNLEQHETDRSRQTFEARRKAQMKLARNRAHPVPLLEIIGGVALAVVLAIAGARITAHQMTFGDLMGMIGAFATATPAARAMGQFNTILNEASSALDRVYELIDEPETIVEKPGAEAIDVSRGEVAFENVSFSYEETPALAGVSFTVQPGETVALVGPSGAGKSTVFSLLPRLYDVSGGAVRIDGQDVRDVTLASLRASMALVAQEAALFNDTIRSNIALGREGATHAEIEEAAKNAAAHEFITALPQGYDTIVGDRGGNLSGGERQRVALARAFLRNAPILLLDEATSALDAESEAKVQQALARLAKGRTVLVIAHRLATVRDADRILVFDQGKIVEMGKHDGLIAENGLYARLSRLQFHVTEAKPAG